MSVPTLDTHELCTKESPTDDRPDNPSVLELLEIKSWPRSLQMLENFVAIYEFGSHRCKLPMAPGAHRARACKQYYMCPTMGSELSPAVSDLLTCMLYISPAMDIQWSHASTPSVERVPRGRYRRHLYRTRLLLVVPSGVCSTVDEVVKSPRLSSGPGSARATTTAPD